MLMSTLLAKIKQLLVFSLFAICGVTLWLAMMYHIFHRAA